MDIVRSARKRRLSVTIFTNATLLTEKQMADLRSLYIDEIHVSIYSAIPSIHDGITRVSGSFIKSVGAIKKMVATGITVRIKCPLMNMTAGGIKEIKELGKELGVNIQYSMIITVRNDGNFDTHQYRLKPDHMNKADIKKIQDRILNLLPKDKRSLAGVLLTDSCSEVSRLVASWIQGAYSTSRSSILKGINVCGSQESHDILVVFISDGDIY